MKLSTHLLRLLLGLFVPLLIAVAALATVLVEREENAAEARLRNGSEELAADIDDDIAKTISVLEALASARDLSDDDLSEAIADTARVPMIGHEWQRLVLADGTGRSLFETSAAGPSAGPRGSVAGLEAFRTAWATGRPAVSPVLVVNEDGSATLPVAVPVGDGGRSGFVLIAMYDPGALVRFISHQRRDKQWQGTVLDAAQRIIASSRYPTGSAAPEPLKEALAAARENRILADIGTGVVSEGFPVLTAAGWRALMIAPEEALAAGAWQTAWLVGGVSAAFLAVALGAAIVLSRWISGPIGAISELARRLGTDRPLPPLAPSSVAEVRLLGSELERAAALIRAQQEDSRAANARSVRRASQQAELAELGIAALGHHHLDALLTAATERTAKTLGADCCSMFVVMPGGRLLMRAGYGWGPGVVGTAVLESGPTSPSGYALATGEPVVCGDYAAETRFALPAVFREHGLASGVSVLIYGLDGPFGVLSVEARAVQHFTSDDVSLVQAVANILSMAVRNKAADDALRRSERRFRDFAEAASDWMWEMGPDLRFTYLSREPFVSEHGSIVGKRLTDLPPHVDPEAARQNLATIEARQPIRDFLHSFALPDGQVRHIRISGRPVYSDDMQFLGYRGTSTDVTSEIEKETRLHQAQKMEAVGQLTGGVAHDFNNLLAVIIGNSEMLLDIAKPDQEASQTLLRQIDEAGLRGAALTQRLLTFSRQQSLKTRPVDVNRLVRGMEPLLKRTLGEPVEIRTALADDLWETLVDDNQLENALLNLAVNARDAMPRGGSLTIQTSNLELDDTFTVGVNDLPAGAYVQIAVSDTGTGMTPDVRQRVFEPFFTTKEPGKGTGLGLSMVYGFARQSGGHATIYSEVGVGTTVKLYLPRANGGQHVSDPQSQPAVVEGEGENVLLVEDDPEVRIAVLRMLTTLGYETMQAANAAEALAVIRSGSPLDLIVTDVVMPGGMDGWELAETVWQDQPDLPVLFVTGYSDNVILQRAVMDNRVRALSKPFRQRELARAVRECLDRRAPRPAVASA